MSAQYDSRTIKRRFGFLALLILGPLAVLLTFLGAREYHQQVSALLKTRDAEVTARELEVEALVALVRSEVQMLASGLIADLEIAWETAPRPVGFDLGIGDRVLYLNRRPDPTRGDRHGVILGIPNAVGSRPGSLAELAAVDRMFPVQAASHAANTRIVWSYFLSSSRDFAAIYPWAPVEKLLGPVAERNARFAAFFDSEVMKLFAPRSGDRQGLWTNARPEFSRTETVMSFITPVNTSRGGQGVVGADLPVALIQKALASEGDMQTSFAVVDAGGALIAASHSGTADGMISPLLQAGDWRVPGFARKIGDVHFATRPIDGAAWWLVTSTPETSIRGRALWSAAPYGLVFACVMLACAGFLLILSRQIVEPASRLLQVIEAEAEGRPISQPKVPGFWLSWFATVREAYGRQRRSMEELRDAEALTKAVIDVALEAIVTADENGRVVSFNPAAEQIFGIGAEEAIGRTISEIMVPDHHRERHEGSMHRLREGAEPIMLGKRLELEAKRSDGTIFPVELQLHMLPHHGQRLFTAYIRDMSAIRAKERELQDQQTKLHQAEKMTAMGSLLAGVAHELNNPLAVVVAQSMLLQEMADTPATRSRAERIRAAAERCGRIIKTFLAMARQQAPVRQSVDLAKVIENALAVTGYSLRTSGILIDRIMESATPTVEGDADQITQVVSNLLINAQQALAPVTGREKRVQVALRQSADGLLRLTVSDNGPGVPAHLRDKIFEPFFTTKPAGVGTGIGLSVCQNIARAHGGTISLHESDAGGAAFTLTLPLALPVAEDAAAESGAGAMPGFSVLVVDDEPDVGATLVEIIEAIGGHAVLVGSRSAALQMLDSRAFTLIMSDMRMPDGGGLELGRDLAARGDGSYERLILVTGDTVSGPSAVGEHFTRNPPPILEKPFSLSDVRTLVTERIGAMRASGGFAPLQASTTGSSE